MTLALLLVLGQAGPIIELPATMDLVRGAGHAVAFNGSEFVVVWADDRKKDLRRRPLTARPATELWWARIAPDGGALDPVGRSACVAQPSGDLSIAVNPTSGTALVSWAQPGGQVDALGLALLHRDGGASCLGLAYDSSDTYGSPSSVWTGSQFLVTWVSNGNLASSWFSPAGVAGLNAVQVLSLAQDAPISVAATDGGAMVAWVNPNQSATSITIAENTAITAPGVFSASSGTTSHFVLEPSGQLVVATAPAGGAFASFLGAPAQALLAGSPVSSAPSVTTVPAWGAAGLSLAAFERASDITLVSFARDAGVQLWPLISSADTPRLASDGVGAIVVYRNADKGLEFRSLGFTGTRPQVGVGRPVVLTRAVQREPSVAWVDGGFLIAYEEQGALGVFEPRFQRLTPTGSLQPFTTSLGGVTRPSVSTRPNGQALLRGNTPVLRTTTSDLLLSSAAVLPGSIVLSTGLLSGGGASNARVLHWSVTPPFLFGLGPGQQVLFPGAELGPSSTGTATGLWLPVVTPSNELRALFIADSLSLSSNTSLVPQLQVATGVRPEVSPVVSAADPSANARLLFGWATASQVSWTIVSPDGGLAPGATPDPGVLGLALASTGTGEWVLSWIQTDGGLTVRKVLSSARADGVPVAGNIEALEAGEPRAASAPSGQVAIVWPAFSPATGGVGVRALLVNPPGFDAGLVPDAGRADAGPGFDAGVPDAGGLDAGAFDGGAGDAGGPALDGGGELDAGAAVDGGPERDAGLPVDAGPNGDAGPAVQERPDAGPLGVDGGSDGGDGVLRFSSAPCGCSAPGPGGVAALALALAAARRRRR